MSAPRQKITGEMASIGDASPYASPQARAAYRGAAEPRYLRPVPLPRFGARLQKQYVRDASFAGLDVLRPWD